MLETVSINWDGNIPFSSVSVMLCICLPGPIQGHFGINIFATTWYLLGTKFENDESHINYLVVVVVVGPRTIFTF